MILHTLFTQLFEQKPKYYIDIVGLASDSIESVIIDDKYGLIQFHASYSTALVPLKGRDHPRFEEVVFYTNCLSYEHEVPAYIVPAKGKALIKPIEKGPSQYLRNSYYDTLSTAYEMINSLRLGPLGYVYFRWPSSGKIVNLNYSNKFNKVAKELSLYSTALRQLDPLSEFLGYYRIIESLAGGNGKDWLVSNLDRIQTYDFGFLHFESSDNRYPYDHKKRINLFSKYRSRACIRLKVLKSKLETNKKIAEYFYNENRCGIAHGKAAVKAYDFGINIIEIAKDTIILKLLSRLGIEENLKNNRDSQIAA